MFGPSKPLVRVTDARYGGREQTGVIALRIQHSNSKAVAPDSKACARPFVPSEALEMVPGGYGVGMKAVEIGNTIDPEQDGLRQ